MFDIKPTDGIALYCLYLPIGKNNNTRTVQAESSKFASVLFDKGFQIWVGWNWSECHLLVFCIDPIIRDFLFIMSILISIYLGPTHQKALPKESLNQSCFCSSFWWCFNEMLANIVSRKNFFILAKMCTSRPKSATIRTKVGNR